MYKETILWLLGLVLVSAVAYGYAHQRNLQQRYAEFRNEQTRLEDMRGEVESLREKVEETRARVAKMESDPLEIEATARKDGRMTRDGEIIFHIEDAPSPVDTPPEGDISGQTGDTKPNQ